MEVQAGLIAKLMIVTKSRWMAVRLKCEKVAIYYSINLRVT